MKYEWYHTAFKCDDCGHQFVRDGRVLLHDRKIKCPQCNSEWVSVDDEKDADITEAIAKGV